MKKLIINAEDFGFSSKINNGIIYAHKNGIVRNASIIVTKDGFQEAVDFVKQNPQLDIGIHLDLDKFFNIDHEIGLVMALINNPLQIDEISQEIKEQINKLKNLGINPTHISSHHSAHLDINIFPIVCVIAKEYNIKIVQFPERFYLNGQQKHTEYRAILEQYNLFFIPHFIRGWYLGNIDEEYAVAELVTHPGYGEIWREHELACCCNMQIKIYLREKDIKLTTFTDFINSNI